MKSLLGAGTAVLLALMVAAMALPVEKADAAKMTACVNKKNGTMKMVFGKKAKKKCPKGYKKVTWNSQGPAGPNLSVYDSTGKRVGRFLGVSGESGLLVFEAARQGGIYNYLSNGSLLPGGFQGGGVPVSFKTNDCTGNAYVAASGMLPGPWYIDFLTRSLSGMNRIVYRSFQGTGFGTPSVWVGNMTSEEVTVAIPTYEFDDTGACVPDQANFTGTLFGLDSVPTPTPYDFTGPLEVR